MSLEKLAERHRALSPELEQRSQEEVLLWYADLGIEVQGDEYVGYHCTRCGTPLSMVVDEFMHRDSNDDLRCSECRGDVEERGGAMA